MALQIEVNEKPIELELTFGSLERIRDNYSVVAQGIDTGVGGLQRIVMAVESKDVLALRDAIIYTSDQRLTKAEVERHLVKLAEEGKLEELATKVSDFFAKSPLAKMAK